MDEFLEKLIAVVEQDELEQPARDALLANLYAGLDGPGLDSYAGDFILAGIDMYGTVCSFVAVHGALLNYLSFAKILCGAEIVLLPAPNHSFARIS